MTSHMVQAQVRGQEAIEARSLERLPLRRARLEHRLSVRAGAAVGGQEGAGAEARAQRLPRGCDERPPLGVPCARRGPLAQLVSKVSVDLPVRQVVSTE